MSASPHLNFFVGAEAPAFSLFHGFEHVSHTEGKAFRVVKFRDFDALGPAVAADYYWLFSLKRTLCAMGRLPHTITLAGRDRFTLHAEVGQRLPSDAYLRCLSGAEMDDLDLAPLTGARPGYRWLVGQPYFFDGDQTLLEQYAACHPAQDLLKFCADALDCCLSPQYVSHFLQSRFMIRSPAVGTFETAPFFKMLDILENITLHHCKSTWVQRTGYQAGNIGFLLERLHSYLLTVHLEDAGLLNDPAVYGHLTLHTQ